MFPYEESLDQYYQAEFEEAECRCDNCDEILEDFDAEERTCNQCAFESIEDKEENNFTVRDSEFQITGLPSDEMIAAANKIANEIFEGDSYYVFLKHKEGGSYEIELRHTEGLPFIAISKDEEDNELELRIGSYSISVQNIDHALSIVFSLHNKEIKKESKLPLAA